MVADSFEYEYEYRDAEYRDAEYRLTPDFECDLF
jgi:hypothetical protein